MYVLAENLDFGNLFWLIVIIIVTISQLTNAKKRKQKLSETQKTSSETSLSAEKDNLFTSILYPVEVELSQPSPVLESEMTKQPPRIRQQTPVSAHVIELPRVEPIQTSVPPPPKIEPEKQQPVVPTVKLSNTNVRLDLSSVDSLRNAVIVREILGPPLALRDARSSPPYSPGS